jgi:hypothetical protein
VSQREQRFYGACDYKKYAHTGPGAEVGVEESLGAVEQGQGGQSTGYETMRQADTCLVLDFRVREEKAQLYLANEMRRSRKRHWQRQ